MGEIIPFKVLNLDSTIRELKIYQLVDLITKRLSPTNRTKLPFNVNTEIGLVEVKPFKRGFLKRRLIASQPVYVNMSKKDSKYTIAIEEAKTDDLIRMRAIEGVLRVIFLREKGREPSQCIIDALVFTYMTSIDTKEIEIEAMVELLEHEYLNIFERLSTGVSSLLVSYTFLMMNSAIHAINIAYELFDEKSYWRDLKENCDNEFEEDLVIVLDVLDELENLLTGSSM